MQTSLATVIEHIASRKFLFVGVFTIIFFVSLSVLNILGIGPRTLEFQSNGIVVSTTTPPASDHFLPAGTGELPVRIEIPKIGIQTLVTNPTATDIASLDAALLAGAVRYPQSGRLGEKGNVLIFGHSSHLPVVHNQAFRAFNDIQKLEKGDPIFVISEGKVYVYAVDAVEKVSSTTGEISLAADGAKLTLATCNNFGSTEDRFVVTATLVKTETLEN